MIKKFATKVQLALYLY